MTVSRETAPPDPEVVAALFPLRDKEIYRYVDLLTTEGVTRGLIGPREAPRLWDRHVVNCAVVREIFTADSSLADVGSGAGLPGLVLALARPDLRVTLIEPLLRRVTFLADVVAELAITNVAVVRSRAEDLGVEHEYDWVTSRAVAPLTRLVPWTLPLCRSGGEVVALKGSSAPDEVAAAAKVIQAYGGSAVRVEEWGLGMASTPTTVVRIKSGGRQASIRKGRR